MTRYAFALPQVQVDNEWTLGLSRFRPARALLTEVRAGMDEAPVGSARHGLNKRVLDLVEGWSSSATIEVDAKDDLAAARAARESLSVLRFLMREIVEVNVDFHKIGLEGDLVKGIREIVAIGNQGRHGAGWKRVDGPVAFRFASDALNNWSNDDRVLFLSQELSLPESQRSALGRRALTALSVLDTGFLAVEPVVKTLFCVVAVEVMLSAEPGGKGQQRKEPPLAIARRVAYLTCPAQCGRAEPACPYVKGFPTERALTDFARQLEARGEEWRCSTFLQVSCPPALGWTPRTPALFAARNEIVHEGRTSLSEQDVKWIRHHADAAINGAIRWFAAHPAASIDALDREIDAISGIGAQTSP